MTQHQLPHQRRPPRNHPTDQVFRVATARAATAGRLLLLTATLLAALASLATAQDLSADDVLARMKERAETLRDASFLLTGNLIDPDGTEIALEIEVELVTEPQVARAYFIQPDALADNFIVLDGDAVYNYVFLTNQVTVFDANDPDALGGLLPAEQDGRALELTLDLDRLFAGWEVEVADYLDTPEGSAYLLRFRNGDPEAVVTSVEATVLDELWTPYQLVFYQSASSVLADLAFEHLALDQGLDPEDVAFIPDDAEVIDERAR